MSVELRDEAEQLGLTHRQAKALRSAVLYVPKRWLTKLERRQSR